MEVRRFAEKMFPDVESSLEHQKKKSSTIFYKKLFEKFDVTSYQKNYTETYTWITRNIL